MKMDHMMSKLENVERTIHSSRAGPATVLNTRGHLEVWPERSSSTNLIPAQVHLKHPLEAVNDSPIPVAHSLPALSSRAVSLAHSMPVVRGPAPTRSSPSSPTTVLSQTAALGPSCIASSVSLGALYSPDVTSKSRKVSVRIGDEDFSFDPASVPDVPTVSYSQKLDDLFKHWDTILDKRDAYLVVEGRGIPVKYWPEFYNKRKGMTNPSSWDAKKGQWGKWRVRALILL